MGQVKQRFLLTVWHQIPNMAVVDIYCLYLTSILILSAKASWLCLGNPTSLTIKPGGLRDEHVTHSSQSWHFKILGCRGWFSDSHVT